MEEQPLKASAFGAEVGRTGQARTWTSAFLVCRCPLDWLVREIV